LVQAKDTIGSVLFDVRTWCGDGAKEKIVNDEKNVNHYRYFEEKHKTNHKYTLLPKKLHRIFRIFLDITVAAKI
jgi:hypothetical protein